MYNNDFFQNMNMENNISGDNNYINQDMDVDINMINKGTPMVENSTNNGVQERVINRTFVHEVPQDCFFMIEKQRSISIKFSVNKNTSNEYTSIDI